MKYFALITILAFSLQNASFTQSKTRINLTSAGKIGYVLFDFRHESGVQPLTGICISRDGQVQYMNLDINGHTIRMDQFGEVITEDFSNYESEYDDAGRLEKLKMGFTTVARFDYDFDGRLQSIKDGSFITKFKLQYDFGGKLKGIDKGGFNYVYRVYYNSSDEIYQIKDKGYTVLYRFDYNSGGSLKGLKNSSFEYIAKVSYHMDRAKSVSCSTNDLTIFIGSEEHYSADYDGVMSYGIYSSVVDFFEHADKEGESLSYSFGQFPTVPSGWNDKISSIRIPNGVKVIVYEHENFEGMSKSLYSDWSAMFSNEYWNDKISSFKIVKA